MTDKQLKWSILILPPISVLVFEHIRHDFFSHSLSTEVGNWLASILVFVVLIAFTWKLFSLLEKNREQLQRQKAQNMLFEERERLAHTLHDGIAQSLFLLSVKLKNKDVEAAQTIVLEVDAYVRESIAALKQPQTVNVEQWKRQLQEKLVQFQQLADIHCELDWQLSDTSLFPHEQTELTLIMNESLQNIYKHANASHVRICSRLLSAGWQVQIIDDGQGFSSDRVGESRKFGLDIMSRRCERMGWLLSMTRMSNQTMIEIKKGS
jgi:two-component system nitrate/nitrite sensor histidine kinase NarQ